MKFIAALIFGLMLVTTPVKAGSFIEVKVKSHVAIILDTEVNDKSVEPLIKAIDKANEDGATAIVLEINSPGGFVEPGLKLVKRIERSDVPVVCVVDGDAASMASYILESCQTRVMTKRSTIMIHELSAGDEIEGQQTRFKNMFERMAHHTRGMMEHYALHLRMPLSEIQSHVNGGTNWYMSWDEALKAHAVDFVVDSYNDIFLK